jgi:hypothetical protein
MTKHINRLSFLVVIVAVMASCTKRQDIQPRDNVFPAIPLTVQNAADYRPDPTVTTPLATGPIQIILSIPANSGRTIKDVKVAAAASATTVQGTTGLYTAAPIAGSGTTATFNTSLTEYFTKYPASTTNPAAKANTELALRFYFLVTLDNGTTIVSTPVRVLVL